MAGGGKIRSVSDGKRWGWGPSEDMKKMTRTFGFLSAIAIAALMIACGGGSTSPSGSGSPTPTPTPAPAGLTITITSAGVSPKTLTVARGSQVTFVNNDNQIHDELSDPHPEHTDCPELQSVGFMNPGESRQTLNLNTAKSCGYHDHELFTDPRWQGTIIIQ
jgi:plastocyanin